jgi:DNA-binding response OmpR family regulator
VDDDPEIRRLISLALRRKGMDVALAPGGGKAVEISKGRRPDLAVVDVVMPEMDGAATAAALRETCGNDLYILAISGHTDVMDLASRMGAHGRLLKPFRMDELVLAVQRGLIESGRCSQDASGQVSCP